MDNPRKFWAPEKVERLQRALNVASDFLPNGEGIQELVRNHGAVLRPGDPNTLRCAGVSASCTWSFSRGLLRNWAKAARPRAMADRTHIEWCHATVNAISGCTVVSPGCTNCYAMRAGGHKRPRHPSNGLTMPSNAGHVWTGAVRLNDEWLRRPLTWQKPRRIFWNAHRDAWHESVPVEWVDREFAVAALTPHHRHLFLTKRSALMRAYINDVATPERILEQCKALGGLPTHWQWPLPNVWLGVSVEDQQRAHERIPDLLDTPAAVRWLSAEPLLGGIGIAEYLPNPLWNDLPSWKSAEIDWIVCGGESGPGARPMHPAWPLWLRKQCEIANIPFLFKQWGDWAPVSEMDDAAVEAYYAPAPKRDPEAHRRCKVGICVLHGDGTRFDGEAMYRRPAFEQGSGAMTMMHIGKRSAGRLLDGQLHDAYPELFAWELREREAAHA